MKRILVLIVLCTLFFNGIIYAKTVRDIGYVDSITCFLLHPLMNEYSETEKNFIVSDKGKITPELMMLENLKKEYLDLLKYKDSFIGDYNVTIEEYKSQGATAEKLEELDAQLIEGKKQAEKRLDEIKNEFEKRNIKLENITEGEKKVLKLEILKKIDSDIKTICNSLKKKYKLLFVADCSALHFNQIEGIKIYEKIFPKIPGDNPYSVAFKMFKNQNSEYMEPLIKWIMCTGYINNAYFLEESGKLVMKNGKNLTNEVIKIMLDNSKKGDK